MTETPGVESEASTMVNDKDNTDGVNVTVTPFDTVAENIKAASTRARDVKYQISEQMRFYGYTEADRIVIETLPPGTGDHRGSFYAWSHSLETLTELANKMADPFQGIYTHADPILKDSTAKFPPDQWVRQSKGSGFVSSDVAELRALKIDVDPERAGGARDISAHPKEMKKAVELSKRVYNDVASMVGTDAIAYLFSGNGVQLHVALDGLANNDANETQMHRALLTLDRLYSGDGVKIDISLWDPRRIIPLAGTPKRKGNDDIALERRHRFTWIYAPEHVERLSQKAFDALVDAFYARLNDEQKESVEEAIRKGARSPVQPVQQNTKSKSEGKKKSNWTELFEKANEVSIREVGSRLGLDANRPTCPACGAGGGGSDVAYVDHKGMNTLKCQHNTCGQKAYSPTGLVAKVAFQLDDLKGNKEGCFNVLKWFHENFGLDEPKASRKKASKSGPGMNLNDADEEADVRRLLDGKQPSNETRELPCIVVDTHIHRVLDEAIEALSHDPDLYAMGNSLVTIVNGDDGTPRTKRVSARLLEVRYLSRCATWLRYDSKKDEWIPVLPPEKVAQAVQDAEEYPGHRKLVGIAVSPVMRADGTILDSPGYDSASKLYYQPNADYGVIPSNPSKADAERAVESLMEVVCDMPLSETHKAAWLSWLLSYFARPMFSGPTPMFVLDANSPGAAKTLLTRATSIIATGREPAQIQYTFNQDEIEKRITAMLIAGPAFSYFDNIDDGGKFGGPKLEALATSDLWGGRLLGKSEQIELPNKTIWSVTGNNLVIQGSMLRRVVHIRFETLHERPEDRDDFKHPDLIGWIRANRERLVRDALTIIRAWVVANRPKQGITLGSYEGWCQSVGEIVHWLTGTDVTTTREALLGREGSGDTQVMERLIPAWQEHLTDEVSTKDIVKMLADEDRRMATEIRRAERAGEDIEGEEFVHKYRTLRDAITEFAPGKNAGLPSPVGLGRKLSKQLGRVVSGYRFVSRLDPKTKAHLWTLQKVNSPEMRRMAGDRIRSISGEKTPINIGEKSSTGDTEDRNPILSARDNSNTMSHDIVCDHISNISYVKGQDLSSVSPVSASSAGNHRGKVTGDRSDSISGASPASPASPGNVVTDDELGDFFEDLAV